MADNSVDLIFADPPYNLSSEVYIDKLTGKPDLKKANDFMNKWAGLDSKFLEEFYKQAYRILKNGGHCLLFGIDRQLFMFEYYANLSGFTQKQSLYWYFISNFPKASDLSKNLDKYFGAEREVVGKNLNERLNAKKDLYGINGGEEINITTPSTDLAKKYDGIKYSVAPLKQVVETIMVFQKPYKTGSCLHDVLAMENGDETITCGGVDIEGNRVGVGGGTKKATQPKQESKTAYGNGINGNCGVESLNNGRFPAQTYISSEASEIIDLQSGYTDTGGASKILHKCDFEAGDYDLYNYCPKVSKSERNEGLEGFEEKIGGGMAGTQNQSLLTGSGNIRNNLAQNNHPTVKPKALLSKILKLFKTPNNQVLLDPFMGSGSMGISAVETGFNYIGIELDSEYFEIAKSRVEKAYYSNNIEMKSDIINLSDYRPSGESQLRFFK
jgi:site-specific DNA-methyltransferase (adenine-specific)